MIDLCVAINGTNLDCMAPMFFESLITRVDTSDVNVHVVEMSVGGDVHAYLTSLYTRFPQGQFKNYVVDDPFMEETGPEQKKIWWMGGDTALRCDWMMKHCGGEKWVVICHFDIAFKDNFIQRLIPALSSDTGMVGHHCDGLVAINRVAYNQCFVGFQSINNFFVVRDTLTGKHKLRHGGDYRCTDKSLRIEGFDVGELLELNLGARYWALKPFKANIDHIRAGSGYHNNPATAKTQRQRAMDILGKMGAKCL